MQIHLTIDTDEKLNDLNARTLRAIADQLAPVSSGETKQLPIDLIDKPSPRAMEEASHASSAPLVPKAAPAPPAVAAPASTSVPAAAPATSVDVERDVNGFSWDERIHSGNHGKNKDGTWRYLRGVDKSSVVTIEAQLRAEAPVVAAAKAAPPPPPSTGITFEHVMARVTTGLAGGLLKPSEIVPRLKELGVENLPGLNGRPDLWAVALEKLGV